MKNTNKKQGTQFEQDILKQAKLYEAERILVLRKVDPPTNVIRIGGKPIVIQRKSDFVDFVGVIIPTGRAVFIEAKTTKTGRLPFCRDGGITQRQVDALRLWHHAGALVGVLWRVMDEPTCDFWVDHDAIAFSIRTGAKSIRQNSFGVTFLQSSESGGVNFRARLT